MIKLGKDIPGDQNVDRVLATVDKIDGKNGLKVSESLVLYIINDYVHFFLLDVPYDNLDIDGKFLKISTSRIDPTCNNKFIIIFKNGGGGQSFYNII